MPRGGATQSRKPCDWQIVYYAFDLLELEGDDLKNRRLAERKARPQQVLSGSEVRYYAEPGSAETVARTVSDAELEGVIAKKARFHLPRPGAGALTGSTSS